MNTASATTDGRGLTPEQWAGLTAACAAYEPPSREQMNALLGFIATTWPARTYGLPPMPADRRRAARRYRSHVQPASSEDDVPLAAA